MRFLLRYSSGERNDVDAVRALLTEIRNRNETTVLVVTHGKVIEHLVGPRPKGKAIENGVVIEAHFDAKGTMLVPVVRHDVPGQSSSQ